MSQHVLPRFVPRAKEEARKARPWVRALCRAGYGARAVLYATIGGLAAAAAIGSGGATTDSKGALRSLHAAPFGQVVLTVIALGLAGFALWRFVEAALDPEHDGHDGKKGIARRIGRAVAGLLHVALAVYALGIATGGALGTTHDGGGAQSWTAKLMAWPGGPVLVGLGGLGAIAFGVAQLVEAFRADLDGRLDLSSLSSRARRVAVSVCRFGIGARGVVAVIIGGALVLAGWHANPSEAKGVGEALAALQAASYGWLLLAIVALGLIAFGAYQALEARYRRIRV